MMYWSILGLFGVKCNPESFWHQQSLVSNNVTTKSKLHFFIYPIIALGYERYREVLFFMNG